MNQLVNATGSSSQDLLNYASIRGMGPVSPTAPNQDTIHYFDAQLKSGNYLEAVGTASYYGIPKEALAQYSAGVLGIPEEEALQYLKSMGYAFADGGAFTNGIVTRPTLFDKCVMGESGSEGILPLSNVGGKLGVHANLTGGISQEIVAELRALRQQNEKLQREIEQLRKENGQAISKSVDRMGMMQDQRFKESNTLQKEATVKTDAQRQAFMLQK